MLVPGAPANSIASPLPKALSASQPALGSDPDTTAVEFASIKISLILTGPEGVGQAITLLVAITVELMP